MDNILLSTEVDLYVDTMHPQTIDSIGSKNWLEWHQRLQKLNQEAVIEASAVKEEYVKETLISFNKIPVLVHEAILINLWKYKILPLLLRMEPDPPNTFVAYSVLYHEAVCVALLELVMYHSGASEALGDAAVDLLDYTYGTVSQLLVLSDYDDDEKKIRAELFQQMDDLAFNIGIRSITILRYLAEHLDRLPLGVAVRIFGLNDIPVLLTQILLEKPWIRNGKQYLDGQWKVWDGEAIVSVEAQIWLALRQLLLDAACRTHYDITDSRRSQLMKLQPLLSPIILDQISPLLELQQWLYRLSVTDQPSVPNKPILLEMMLEIKMSILSQCEHKWKKIAKEQLPVIFCKNSKEIVEVAQSLGEAYNIDLLEKFEAMKKISTHICNKCGKNAIQRCSRCKKKWYCSRRCQVNDWADHKDECVAD